MSESELIQAIATELILLDEHFLNLSCILDDMKTISNYSQYQSMFNRYKISCESFRAHMEGISSLRKDLSTEGEDVKLMNHSIAEAWLAFNAKCQAIEYEFQLLSDASMNK